MKNLFIKVVLTIIAIGVWANIYQNQKIINNQLSKKPQKVIVLNQVDVTGEVEIENEVDINISKIGGDETWSRNGRLVVDDYWND
ncbi:hypothetical protein MHL31_09030 [Lutibacter sp. A80]|uniref:hypothetical protein n=1 Tax=Lutibacter sp. A80 TaxID=2918453 RepID=UPI001F060D9F|nr:hypothetical protein [Lutibacter sp. A80]UMB59223.1 hypothetical protein MHL31_09030 [Lutibacter sp. A80]